MGDRARAGPLASNWFTRKRSQVQNLRRPPNSNCGSRTATACRLSGLFAALRVRGLPGKVRIHRVGGVSVTLVAGSIVASGRPKVRVAGSALDPVQGTPVARAEVTNVAAPRRTRAMARASRSAARRPAPATLAARHTSPLPRARSDDRQLRRPPCAGRPIAWRPPRSPRPGPTARRREQFVMSVEQPALQAARPHLDDEDPQRAGPREVQLQSRMSGASSPCSRV